MERAAFGGNKSQKKMFVTFRFLFTFPPVNVGSMPRG